jgi:Late embryogenesis abundant protein
MNKIWILIAGLVGFVVYKKYDLSKKLVYSVSSIDAGGGLMSSTVNIVLSIFNPTDTTADLQSLNLNVIANGNTIGTIYTNQTFKILQGQNSITIPLQLQNFSAIASLINIVANVSAKIQLTGTATVDFIPFPVSITYNV